MNKISKRISGYFDNKNKFIYILKLFFHYCEYYH